MYLAATQHVAKAAGSKTLHAVTDLNSAERFHPLCLAKQKRSFWFWKKPKILPTDVKLQDVLTKPLELGKDVLTETTLMEKYKENPHFGISGDLGGSLAKELKLDVNTVDSFDLTVDLGDIVKERVVYQSVCDAVKEIPVNVDHELLQEVRAEKRTSLVIVLESLSCKANGKLQEDDKASASADIEGGTENIPVVSKVSVNAKIKGSIEKTTTHSYEIPPGTVMAFSCNRIDIGTDGGMVIHPEVDQLDETDGKIDVAIKKSGEEKILKVQVELKALLEHSNFSELQSSVKGLMGDPSDGLQAVHLLLSNVELNILRNKEEKLASSTFSHLLGPDRKDWEVVMSHLGFIVPVDMESSDSVIVCPSADPNGLINSCLHLWDSLADVTKRHREMLVAIPKEYYSTLLTVIDNGVKGMETKMSDIRDVLSKEPKVQSFLTDIGFIEVTMDDVECLINKGQDEALEEDLVDLYAAVYFLSQ